MTTSEVIETPGYAEVKAGREDYGIQFETLVSYIYHHLVGDGSRVIDGGANAGLHATPLAALVAPTGFLTCFEPNPQTCDSLRRNLVRPVAAGTAEVRQEALGNVRAELRFIVNSKRSALSRIFTDSDKLDENESVIVVPVVKLDEVVSAGRVDFIKLDLEGFDFNGMRGGEKLIGAYRPPIIFENGRGAAARRHGYTKEEFFAWFDAMGYVITDLHNRPLTPESWTSKDLAFEFVTLHRDDPRRDFVQRIIHAFWTSLPSREVAKEWRTCVTACRDPIGFVGARVEA